jgi:hypothetical protein
MPKSLAMLSSRGALLVAALLAAPALVLAQGRTGPASRVEAVVVTIPAVRVRTAPTGTSLTIDEFTQGTVFPLAPDEYQSKDWFGVMLDGRVAFLPRNAATPRVRGSRAVIAEPPPEVAAVTQAGAPAPAPAATPAAMATRQAPMPEPAPAYSPAPAAAVAAPAPATAPALTPAPAPAPERVAERPAATVAPPTAPSPATPEPKADQPAFSARRAGLDLTVGLLGSVTPIKSTNGLTPSAHIAGVSFLGVKYRAIGLYGAPEYGQGGGYRSTMLGGGLSLDLISFHALRITALGGYTTYSETPVVTDPAAVPVTRTLQGPSAGGMVSIPFFGPLRLAYRGQYVMAQEAGIPARMTRHYAGLVF